MILYDIICSLKKSMEIKMDLKLYKTRVNDAMKRIAQLEDRLKRVKLHGKPTVYKTTSLKDEVKYLRGLIDANKAMLKILTYHIEKGKE